MVHMYLMRHYEMQIGKTDYVWVFKLIYFLFRDQDIVIPDQRADEIHLSTDAWQLAIV